jgi:hypothetical protein
LSDNPILLPLLGRNKKIDAEPHDIECPHGIICLRGFPT